ncbi:alpha/beta hydrolase [Methylobacterium sp. P31]
MTPPIAGGLAEDPAGSMPRLDDLSRADVPFRTGQFWSYTPQNFHRIAYVEWGDPDSPDVVVCVHGLSRQGRDFDALGYRLARMGYRVVCPDLPGRGLSGG